MKTLKITSIIIFTILLLNHNAFTQESTKGVSYKLILEYGGSLGLKHYYDYDPNIVEERRTYFSGIGGSILAINNIAFRDKLLLGIGGGLEYRSIVLVVPMELAGTCFLNFRYNFIKPDKFINPLLNIAIGTRISKEFDGFFAPKPWHLSEAINYGLYSTLGGGFMVKRFSLQCGFMFWTIGKNACGVDVMFKVGLNF